MKLKIENLGPIKEIEVDLTKDFILFCGPNNTGKTYVSYVIYAFLTINSTSYLKYFAQIAKSLTEEGHFQINKQFIEEWLNNTCTEVIQKIGTIFGISEDTQNEIFNKFNLSAIYSEKDFKKIIESSINEKIDQEGSSIIVKKESKSDIIRIEKVDGNILPLSSSLFNPESLLFSVIYKALSPVSESARMLPVERNSIYTFKTELSLSRNQFVDLIQQDNVKNELDLLGMVKSLTRRYPLAIRSSLQTANDLETVRKYKSDFANVSKEIESNLLQGEISITKNGDVEFHSVKMAEKQKLPFTLSSSLVKTMASLVVYLRHLAKFGDTLIVDEPEMNFHPDVQVHLSRIFAKLANRGIRIIISTHSDYIIREINNMVMASCIVKEGGDISPIGYDKFCTINKNNLDVIFFNYKNNSKTVTTSHLEIKDDGFEVETIDNAIIEQNRKAEWLFDRMVELHEN